MASASVSRLYASSRAREPRREVQRWLCSSSPAEGRSVTPVFCSTDGPPDAPRLDRSNRQLGVRGRDGESDDPGEGAADQRRCRADAGWESAVPERGAAILKERRLFEEHAT